MIVQKDEAGYGLTVSGDKPVYVNNLRESKPILIHMLISHPYRMIPIMCKPELCTASKLCHSSQQKKTTADRKTNQLLGIHVLVSVVFFV